MKTLIIRLKILVIALFFSFISANAYVTQAGQIDIKSAIINEVITNMYSSKKVNDYTCESVEKFSEGQMTKKDCEIALKQTNDKCASLARQQYDYLDLNKEPEQLIKILVSCPVAKMLGYPYEIKNGKPEIQEP